MACNDPGFRIYQDGVIEAELGNARSDLRDLCVGVRARILCVGDQCFERPMLDALRDGRRFIVLPSEYQLLKSVVNS